MSEPQSTVIYESSSRPAVISRHPSFTDAWDTLRACPDLASADLDDDNPGCADALLSDGRILCIEPAAMRNL